MYLRPIYIFLVLSAYFLASMDKEALLLINFFSSFICFLSSKTFATALLSNETDKAALYAFKLQITNDPSGALRSWNDNTDFCNWEGISCSQKNTGRVVSINLNAQGLSGFISSSINNLTFLHHIDLNQNKFFGIIPPSLFKLPRLHFLNLSSNSLHGEIPSNLSSSLITLDLARNHISGSIPSSLGHNSKLIFINLSNNNLTGKIPPSLGNLTSIKVLDLYWNQLEGSMPEEIGNHQRLKYLNVFENKLSGELSASLFNLSLLYLFSVGRNNFEGILPTSFGINLPNLQYLYLDENQFRGSIPDSLTNASKLIVIEMSYNNFSGIIPPKLGGLRLLTSLSLQVNQFEASDHISWKFFDALTNCSNLMTMYLDVNKLSGILPNTIANLSTSIQELGISQNQISGSIPSGISNLINLLYLNLEQNHLTGSIPEIIGKLTRLHVLSIYSCMLTGLLPFSIGNLTQLFYLYLNYNDFNGHIPPSIGNLSSLQRLFIDRNNLGGNIPREVFTLPSILSLGLSFNSLTGHIPSEISGLIYIKELYLQNNKLFGEIPGLISGCMSLKVLNLHSNLIQGNIPPSIGDLRSLMKLDLSKNNLMGKIPEALGTLRGLKYLNLSFNNLVGEVPNEGVFLNVTATSLQGNYGLCGGLLDFHLPACPHISSSKKRWHPQFLLLTILLPSISVFFLILFFILFFNYRKKKLMKNSSYPKIIEDVHPNVSYAELVKATNGFSSINLLGIGQYSSVYKGSLNKYGYKNVAIKVFNLQQRGASTSFVAECEALRCIKHQNLVKIITSCVGIDSKGDDFMAIVLEFMSNGNLDTWLHAKDIEHLNLNQRLDIAINIANALKYLHHECETPIIHCDLKPSNVLLNDNMVAHVGDFGLARLLHIVVSNPLSDFDHSTPVIRGTIGYAAPEYGLGSQASTMGDVYSYGIILLELFTGRRPMDKIFKDGLSLHNFVKMAFPDRVMEVIDPNLQLKFQDDDEICIQSRRAIYECLTSILHLSLLCSKESSRERKSIADVVVELHSIKDAYLHHSNLQNTVE